MLLVHGLLLAISYASLVYFGILSSYEKIINYVYF